MLFMYPETKCHRAIVHLSIHKSRTHGLKHTADYTRERTTSSSHSPISNCGRDNRHFLRVDFTDFNILD